MHILNQFDRLRSQLTYLRLDYNCFRREFTGAKSCGDSSFFKHKGLCSFPLPLPLRRTLSPLNSLPPPSPQYSPAWPWCSVLCATTKTTTSTTRSQAATHSGPLPRPPTPTLHVLLFGPWSLPILSKLSELSGESANLGRGSTTFWQVRSTLLRKSPFSGTSFRYSSVWIFGGKIELSFIFAFSGLVWTIYFLFQWAVQKCE